MRLSLLTAAFIAGFLVALGLSGRTQDYVIGSGLAIHLDGKQHCNTYITPGIGYEHQLSKNWHMALGLYDNSNCNPSAYVAGAWLPVKLGSIKLGTISGLVSGYNRTVLPVGGLVASFERKTWKINLIFIPPAGDTSNGVAWFQFGVPI